LKRNHVERSPKLYLHEILAFIDKIETYTNGMSYPDFAKDSRTIDAVDANERNIGEAVRALAKHRLVKELFYRFHIPYIDLSDMRTDLTHEYFVVNTASMWKTAQTLIILKPQFRKVLDALEQKY
jgi:uncharacterized protein with HEPN domain